MPKYKKRSDGRYLSQIRTGRFKENGKPEVISVYAKSVKELEEKIAETRYKITHGSMSFNSTTTFSEYAQEWLATTKANRGINTKKMYENLLKNHTELITGKQLRKITKMDIQRQINEIKVHPRTCQQLKIMLQQIFEAAVNDDILMKNPVRGIELPRLVTKEKRAFTQAEKLAIKGAEYTAEERAFIMLLYCLGLRRAEALALTWSDVNFKNDEITICKSIVYDGEQPTVCHPKTNSSIRTLTIHPLLKETLKQYKKECKGILLFGNEGRYYTKSTGITLFRHCKNKITDKLGHSFNVSAHYFRHNFASNLYYQVSLKEAIRIMGHSDEKMIMRVYAHLDEQKENTKEKMLKMTL